MLTLDLSCRADHLLLRVSGELDLESSLTFQRRLTELTAQAERRLVVDLSGLQFVDSSGLGALLSTMRLPEERRPRMVLPPSDGSLCRVLRTTRMDSLLQLHPSVESALESALAGSAA